MILKVDEVEESLTMWELAPCAEALKDKDQSPLCLVLNVRNQENKNPLVRRRTQLTGRDIDM